MGSMEVDPNGRVVGFLDMDSFEVQIFLKHRYGNSWEQVYEKQPCIVADPTSERILSVSPLAKTYGISRDTTVSEATYGCENLLVERKDIRHDKPDSSLLRKASLDVRDTILEYRNAKSTTFDMPLQYSPSDEFYLDLTKQAIYNSTKQFSHIPGTSALHLVPRLFFTHLFPFNEKIFGKTFLEVGNFTISNYDEIPQYLHEYTYESNNTEEYLRRLNLVMGGFIVEEIKQKILQKTGFYASGGVAESKFLAKFACNLHKPRGTTIITPDGFNRIAQTADISQVKGIGYETRTLISQRFNNNEAMTINQLQRFQKSQLVNNLEISEELAQKVFDLARGICKEPVTEKLMSNMVTSGKSNYKELFVENWNDMYTALQNLFYEMVEKLEEELARNQRLAKNIKVTISLFNDFSFSIEVPDPHRLDPRQLLSAAFDEFQRISGTLKGRVAKISLSCKPIPV